jgi:hypothetical protein
MIGKKVYTGTYKVVSLFRSSGTRIVAGTSLELEAAEKLASEVSSRTNTKYIVCKEFHSAKYYSFQEV